MPSICRDRGHFIIYLDMIVYGLFQVHLAVVGIMNLVLLQFHTLVGHHFYQLFL